MLPLPVLVVVGLSLAGPAAPAVLSSESPGAPQEMTQMEAVRAADRLFNQQKYDLALKAYKDANAKNGDQCLDCLLGVARSYVKLGAQKNAIDECDRIVRLAESDKTMQGAAFNLKGLALVALANVKRDQKRYAEAVVEFRKALEATPDSAVIHYNMGMAMLSLSQDLAGADEMRTYLEKEPSGPYVANARRLIANPRRARENYAPDFSFTTTDSEYLSLEDLRGKVVVLDFWGTWCPPCVDSVSDLARLVKRMAAEPVVIISVSSDSDEGKWQDFITREKMTWPQYLDRNRAVQRAYSVNVFPSYVVIDHEGILRARLVGSRAMADLQDAIKQGLKARAESAKAQGAPR